MDKALKNADNQDIKFVYTNIRRGSYNHLRSFYRMLKMYGGDYKPQYISENAFNEIVSMPTPMKRW
nr:DUF2202 domain-containing protein [Deferribacter autotrophicus]